MVVVCASIVCVIDKKMHVVIEKKNIYYREL